MCRVAIHIHQGNYCNYDFPQTITGTHVNITITNLITLCYVPFVLVLRVFSIKTEGSASCDEDGEGEGR